MNNVFNCMRSASDVITKPDVFNPEYYINGMITFFGRILPETFECRFKKDCYEIDNLPESDDETWIVFFSKVTIIDVKKALIGLDCNVIFNAYADSDYNAGLAVPSYEYAIRGNKAEKIFLSDDDTPVICVTQEQYERFSLAGDPFDIVNKLYRMRY